VCGEYRFFQRPNGLGDTRRTGIEQSSTYGRQFAVNCERITESVSWVQGCRFGKAASPRAINAGEQFC
jgi:hypothetical protein